LTSKNRRIWAAVLAVLTASGLVSTLAIASPAGAASNEVLILGATVSGGTSSLEAQEVTAQGFTPVVVDDATWEGMTTAQFASYRAIVIGDPTCGSYDDTSHLTAALSNPSTWGAAVNGNVLVIGTDPVLHSGGVATSGPGQLITHGIDFALAQSGKTGAYIDLSCAYGDMPANTPVTLLDGIRAGGFTVDGTPSSVCYNDAHIVATHPALSGLTDADLSNWSCSVHESFDTWPADYTVLAMARNFGSTYTASDGTVGEPYILASGTGLHSFPLSLAPVTQSAQAGSKATVTAQLLDSSTSAPVSGQKISFRVESGPDAGVSGTCSSSCTTDASGQATWSYTGSKATAGAADTVQAWIDTNGDGTPSSGEPQTTAAVSWTTATSSSARYVALGDSVPYGHGLANPTKGTKDGLPADQPPSPNAWPSVLQAGLPGLAPLHDRQNSCDLVGKNGSHFDQLAVSGAPSIDNAWTGPDSDCVYRRGVVVPEHKAVFLDELSAANLRSDPPGLVTIQAGADDIDFAACLASLLGVPETPWMHVENCVNGSPGKYTVTSKVKEELASLATGLSGSIAFIKNRAPKAQIVLVDYYQIIPSADATLKGSSAVCGDVRFSRKGGAWRSAIRSKAEFLQKQLNDTISSVAAKSHGVAFFDISSLFQGHEMCTTDTWLLDGSWDAAHPNATGQWQIGQAVLADCEKLTDHCIG
jgi:lysophospholipase L1-like esterase